MISVKLAALGLPKIKLFWNKGYDIITSVCDITNKIKSLDSNSSVDVVIWPKFGNFSISMRNYHNLNVTRIWPEKPIFLRGSVGWSSIIWTGTWYGLEILHQCDKRVKTKSQKVLGANPYVCRSYRAKTGRGWMGLPPSWIGLTVA